MVFFWLVFYGAVMLVSRHFSPLSAWIVPAGLLLNTAVLTLWVSRRQRVLLSFRQLATAERKLWLQIAPLFLPVVGNLVCFGFLSCSVAAAVTIFLAAVQEELLFRGILLPVLCKRSSLAGVLLSSLAFAAAHFLNVEAGADWLYTLQQAVFALAVGFSLSALTLSSKSLLPGIAIHFLINLTASTDHRLTAESTVLLWLSVVVHILCGTVLLFKYHQKKKGCSYEIIH